MSVRSAPPPAEPDVGSHTPLPNRHDYLAQLHSEQFRGAAKSSGHLMLSDRSAGDAGRGFVSSMKSRTRTLGGHIWSGLTSIGTKAAHHASGMAHAAKGHIATLTNHIAAAHNEVVQSLVSRAGNGNAHINETHFRPHHEISSQIRAHVARVVRGSGLLPAGASANHIHTAADLAADGAHIDHIIQETVNKDPHRSAPIADQRGIVSAVESYVKHAGPAHHAAHRAANAQMAASAAILEGTVAGAAHVDAGHI